MWIGDRAIGGVGPVGPVVGRAVRCVRVCRRRGLLSVGWAVDLACAGTASLSRNACGGVRRRSRPCRGPGRVRGSVAFDFRIIFRRALLELREVAVPGEQAVRAEGRAW